MTTTPAESAAARLAARMTVGDLHSAFAMASSEHTPAGELAAAAYRDELIARRAATLEEVIAPALEEYGQAIDEHGCGTVRDGAGEAGCRCGWKPRRQGRSARRAVSLHQTAARKRADRAYSARCDELMAEARRKGWR